MNIIYSCDPTEISEQSFSVPWIQLKSLKRLNVKTRQKEKSQKLKTFPTSTV